MKKHKKKQWNENKNQRVQEKKATATKITKIMPAKHLIL